MTERIVGIRKEESASRASRKRVERVKRIKGIHIKPIFEWTEWHVWDFIEKYNLPYLTMYDEGFSRVGCCVCPFICSPNLAKINLHRERFPGFYKAFEHAVTWWFYNKRPYLKKKANIHKDFKTPEEFIQAWYRGFK